MTARGVLVVAVAVVAALTACSASDDTARPGTAGPSSAHESSGSPVPPEDPYVGLAEALHVRGVQVWFEADLVKAWLAGPSAFRTATERLGELAARTQVTGFKVADELGYDDGIETAAQGREFLTAVRAQLRLVAPGKQVLIDVIVPDLGCLPWRGGPGTACARQARREYPAADRAAVTSYLRTGLVDRLDLSTGLLDESTYEAWGTTAPAAQQEAWRRVVGAGWGDLTVLQARKALADPGGYRGDAAQAAADLDTYVDLPLSRGARAVDVWTWRQPYDGDEVSLLDSRLQPNPLWTGLQARHASGAVLFTHMTPSAMPSAPDAFARECAMAARVFDAVFVAAGTG